MFDSTNTPVGCLIRHYLTTFFLMAILTKAFLTLVSCHFMTLTLFSARHNILEFKVEMIKFEHHKTIILEESFIPFGINYPLFECY